MGFCLSGPSALGALSSRWEWRACDMRRLGLFGVPAYGVLSLRRAQHACNLSGPGPIGVPMSGELSSKRRGSFRDFSRVNDGQLSVRDWRSRTRMASLISVLGHRKGRGAFEYCSLGCPLLPFDFFSFAREILIFAWVFFREIWTIVPWWLKAEYESYLPARGLRDGV